MRIAVITQSTGNVETVADWDGETPWDPPVTMFGVPLADEDDVQTGDVYGDGKFTRPVLPPETVTMGQLFDVAVQLGLVTIDQVLVLLPITKEDITKDPDGSIVTTVEKIEAIVAEAIKDGSQPPKDIPDTGAVAVAVDPVDPLVP